MLSNWKFKTIEISEQALCHFAKARFALPPFVINSDQTLDEEKDYQVCDESFFVKI